MVPILSKEQAEVGSVNTRILRRSFFAREALLVARDMLGKYLVRCVAKKRIIGKIVEVEAYLGEGDQASHAFIGQTLRNRVLFEGPGLAYVYFVYGNHYCFNVTTNERGVVLIRAIEPVKGIKFMQQRRKTTNLINLTNGPGKLTQAMDITKLQYGIDLTKGKELFICDPECKENITVISSKRIGIKVATEKYWRFFIEENKFVSKIGN